MVEHEQPYLYTPEVLEYPNHTWAAQDIRKANVLFMASYFAENTEFSEKYYSKGNEIYNYVVNTLAQEPTRIFTRILSILMQNHGVKSYVEQNTLNLITNTKAFPYLKTSTNTVLLQSIFSTLKTTTVSNEIKWLRTRFKRIDNLVKYIGR
jgi:hypothetical protein